VTDGPGFADDGPVLSTEEVRLLTEIGFMAGASPILRTETEQLFRQLMVLRPRRAFPYIGLATACLNRGQADEAVSVMVEGVQRQGSPWGEEPPDRDTFDPREDPAMMRVFHGLCLLAARRTAEGEQVLGSLLESCDHPPAVRLARGLLGRPADPAGG
jgi:hypothetical protein